MNALAYPEFRSAPKGRTFQNIVGFWDSWGRAQDDQTANPRKPDKVIRRIADAPDGLQEVRLGYEADEDLFLLEVTTYPERRVSQPMTDDLLLVYLDRGQLPDGVPLVLRPKGKCRVPRSRSLRSRHGFSSCRLNWHVVELCTIPAE